MAKQSDEVPNQTVEAQAGKKVVVDNRPLWKKKRFIIPVALIAAIVIFAIAGGGGDSGDDQAATQTTSGDGATSNDTGSGDSDTAGSDAGDSGTAGNDSGEAGTRDNPLPLGTMHSRDVGFTGTGWDVSIDKVERVPLAVFASAGTTGECIVVSGTATAREVDTEDGLSNIYSFPEVHVVVNGVDLGIDDELACDVQPPGYEGYLTGIDMSLAEGGTAQWVDSFHAAQEGSPIDWVAIEETVYEVPAS